MTRTNTSHAPPERPLGEGEITGEVQRIRAELATSSSAADREEAALKVARLLIGTVTVLPVKVPACGAPAAAAAPTPGTASTRTPSSTSTASSMPTLVPASLAVANAIQMPAAAPPVFQGQQGQGVTAFAAYDPNSDAYDPWKCEESQTPFHPTVLPKDHDVRLSADGK